MSYYRDGSRNQQVLTAINKDDLNVAPSVSDLSEPVPLMFETPGREDRPKELAGSTWQIIFDGQKLYVTVNHNGTTIQEIFLTGPISSVVGKLASKMLRGGFHVREVAHMLDTTTGTHAAWFNERLLTSPEQAVAECLLITERRLTGKHDSAHTNKTTSSQPERIVTSRSSLRSCPECRGPLTRASNCDVCPCGWSKCS